MAAPKKTEAKAPKAAAKTVEQKVDYSAMDTKALEAALAQKQQDLLDAHRSHKTGELMNPRVLSSTRKEIARIHTALNAASKESK